MTHEYRRIAPMAQTYPASNIRKMFNLALDYPEAVKLTVGEPDFNTPEHIKAAGIRAIENNNTRYVANAGIPELRSAIARKYSGRWDRRASARERHGLLRCHGGVDLRPRRHRLSGRRGHHPRSQLPELHGSGPPPRRDGCVGSCAGGQRLQAPCRGSPGRHHRQNRGRDHQQPRSNPLGSVMDRAELEQIADLADEHGFTIISDEVYDQIIFDDAVFTSIAEVRPDFDRFLAVGSFSKTYAMTGWRCGFVIGGEDLIAPMSLLQEGLTSSLPGFVQEAAIAAIEGPQTDVGMMVASYAERREILIDRINAIDGLQRHPPRSHLLCLRQRQGVGTEFLGTRDSATGEPQPGHDSRLRLRTRRRRLPAPDIRRLTRDDQRRMRPAGGIRRVAVSCLSPSYPNLHDTAACTTLLQVQVAGAGTL